MDRFGGDVDWSGYEESARHTCGTSNSTFSCIPFYYVEYGIAQLGALQVWANSKKDRAPGLATISARACSGRIKAFAGTVLGRRMQL